LVSFSCACVKWNNNKHEKVIKMYLNNFIVLICVAISTAYKYTTKRQDMQ